MTTLRRAISYVLLRSAQLNADVSVSARSAENT